MARHHGDEVEDQCGKIIGGDVSRTEKPQVRGHNFSAEFELLLAVYFFGQF